MLIPILNKRLPEELKAIISRKFGSAVWTLDLVLQYFNKELQAKNVGSALHIQHDKRARSCVYCLDNHPPLQCTKITYVQSRINILRKYCKVFHLFKTWSCQQEIVRQINICRLCDGKHHISVCQKPKTDPAKNASNGVCIHVENVNSNILLQTAIANVTDTDGNIKVYTSIMFDTGCQRTYITDNLRKRLNLRIRKERVILKPFG